MGAINNYKDLLVWQKSIKLVAVIYSITNLFPFSEKFGLTNQMRRAAISIPANIAEGYGRKSSGEYIRFLQISVGSLYELQTHIEIGYQLNFISVDSYHSLLDGTIELDRMLFSLIKKLKG